MYIPDLVASSQTVPSAFEKQPSSTLLGTIDAIQIATATPALHTVMQEHGLDSNLPYFEQLVTMESHRKSWEGNEMAASHARLYAILTGCYSYYLAMKSDLTGKEVRTRMKDGLNAFIKDRGFRTLADTHDMNRVVKAVFGDDRRRVSAYALALRVALESGDGKGPIPVADLADWIEKQGGIEEVRRAAKAKGLTVAAKVEIAAATLKDKVLMKFRPDSNTMRFEANDSDKQMLLVVTYRPTGELEINSVVKNDAAVRTALAAHYTNTKADRAKATAVAEIAKRDPFNTVLPLTQAQL